MANLIKGEVFGNVQVHQIFVTGKVLAHGSWLMAEAGSGPGPAPGGAGSGGSQCGAPPPSGAGPGPGPASAMSHEP